MTHNEILRAIVAHSTGDVYIRAAKELAKSSHSNTVLWRIYRQAIAEDNVHYPPDVLSAMQAYDDAMSSKSTTKKTKVLQIRLTENELNRLHFLANKNGQSVSDFIRSRCLNE